MSSKKLHASWLVTWTFVGCLLGICLSILLDNFYGDPWFLIGAALLIAGLSTKSKKAVIFVVLAGLVFGLWRGGSVQFEQNQAKNFIGKKDVISGIVAEDTAFSASGQQRIKLKNVVIDDETIAGTIWVSTNSTEEIKRSDQIILYGQIGEGFGAFSIAIFNSQILEIIRIDNSDPARELRDSFAESVRMVIGEPQASLGIGFLTGQHTTLPEALNNNLKILGLTHIVVASGYNLTILVRFARRFFAGISKFLATSISLFLISGFVLVTGFSPSMSRAALITGLGILAWHYGRRIHPAALLSLAAGLTAMINPNFVWGDLGWYLSFAAFFGVIVLSPLLIHYFWGKNYKPNQLHQIFVETVSAQILTAPIIAFAFGQFAPLSVIANLMILMFIPYAMIFVFVAGLSAGLSASLQPFAAPAELLLSYMTFVVDKLAVLPIAVKEFNFGLPVLIASYLAVLCLVIFLIRRTKHDFLSSSVIE